MGNLKSMVAVQILHEPRPHSQRIPGPARAEVTPP